jgi:hypothetical protein
VEKYFVIYDLGLKILLNKAHETLQGDQFEYLYMIAVVKLSVNTQANKSLYQLYSHTHWIAASIITVYTKSYMVTCVVVLRIT